MFYPDLTRRTTYELNQQGKPHSSYQKYRDEITHDCDARCVYCDITLEEIGFEGFQLDHFRPKDLFPELASDPYNLVLACPKCNRFKWNHWPPEESTLIFVDPFEKNRALHFDIDPNGLVRATETKISKYQIELLYLNRMARVQLRRKRIVDTRIKNAQSFILSETKNLMDGLPKLDKATLEKRSTAIKELLTMFDELERTRANLGRDRTAK